MQDSCLYEGRVMHERREPVRNLFHYPLFLFAVDLDEARALDARLRLFAYNQRGLFSLRDDDHLRHERRASADTTLRQVVDDLLERHGRPPAARVALATSVRIMGYVFNPVSFFYCYTADGALSTVIAEVTNTYHEQKLYVLPATDGARVQSRRSKDFYVSPFIAPDTDFQFQLPAPSELLTARIDAERDGKTILKAVFAARRVALSDRRLLWLFARYPLMTISIVFRIHYQAFKLWVRRVPYFGKEESDRFLAGQAEAQTGASP